MSTIRTILQCPACNALLAFENAASNIKECNSCGVIVRRTGDQLAVDNTLNRVTVKGYQVKPGTTGQWLGKPFTVLGKMGAWFEESFFSYWCIVFKEGNIGFLAEGYGICSILLVEKNEVIRNADIIDSRIGQVIPVRNYQLQKKSSCYYWEVEGELCMPNVTAFFDVYEYAAETGRLFTVFKWSGQNIDTYNNYPCKLDDLQLKNIQAINPYGLQVNCAQCSSTINIKTYPLAQSCTCASCGTYYAIERKQLVKKGKNKNNAFKPLIVPGTKGIIKNIEYEVLGYMQKKKKINTGPNGENTLYSILYMDLHF